MGLDVMLAVLVLGAVAYTVIRAPSWYDRAGYAIVIFLFLAGGAVVREGFKDILPPDKMKFLLLGLFIIQMAAILQWTIYQRQIVDEAADQLARKRDGGGEQ